MTDRGSETRCTQGGGRFFFGWMSSGPPGTGIFHFSSRAINAATPPSAAPEKVTPGFLHPSGKRSCAGH